MKIFFPFGASPQTAVNQTKGENSQRSIVGLLSNNLGHEVHCFPELDNGLVSDSSIALQGEEVPNGEGHPSLQTSLIPSVGPEQPNTAQPNDATNVSGEGHIANAGDLGPVLASDGPHGPSEGEPNVPMSRTSERPQRQEGLLCICKTMCAPLLQTPPRLLLNRLLQVRPIL